MNLPAIKHRLISGFSIAGVLFAVFFLMPDLAAPFILAALAAVMALEFYRMVSAAGIPNFDRYGMLGCVALIGVSWCAGIRPGGDGAWDSVVMFLVVIGIFLRQFPQKNNPHPLQTIGGTLFGVLYIGLLWNFMAKLLLFGRPPGLGGIYWPGRWLLLYAVFAAKFTDIGAYLVGCVCGRHKLIPRISPAKSWGGHRAGDAGGHAAGLGAGILGESPEPAGVDAVAGGAPGHLFVGLRDCGGSDGVVVQAGGGGEGLRGRHTGDGRTAGCSRQHLVHGAGGVFVSPAGGLRNRRQESGFSRQNENPFEPRF